MVGVYNDAGTASSSTRPRRATLREQSLFIEVREFIGGRVDEFREAGRMLDRRWNFESIRKRERARDASFDNRYTSPASQDESGEDFGIQPENRPFYCLSRFVQNYRCAATRSKEPLDLSVMSDRRALIHAKQILIVSWLCTDPDAHKRNFHLTTFETATFGLHHPDREWVREDALNENPAAREAWVDLVESSLLHCKTLALPVLNLGKSIPEAANEAIMNCGEHATDVQLAESGNAEKFLITQRGEIWDFQFGDEQGFFKYSLGIKYIAQLIASEKKGMHVRELDGTAVTFTASEPEAIIDKKAKNALRLRLNALGEARVEARRKGDLLHQAEIDTEVSNIRAELQTATGLGGRDREFESEDSRVRSRVKGAIKRALEKIAQTMPEFSSHLSGSLINASGTHPRYEPDPPRTWIIRYAERT